MLGPAALARAVHVEAQFVRAGFTIRNRHTVTLTQEQGMVFFSDKVLAQLFGFWAAELSLPHTVGITTELSQFCSEM